MMYPSAADVDYVLHRVNQYQSDEPLLVGSTAKPALPPPSSAIRGGSFKGRRSTIAVATPEGDDKAVAQPMRKVSRSPRKPNLLKSTVIGKEQFVEAIIRLSAMDVSALGTGIAKRCVQSMWQMHFVSSSFRCH